MGFDFGGSKSKGRKTSSFMNRPAADNPLAGVEYTGDLQADSDAELDALAQGFRQRRDRDADRFRDAPDTEYWFAVCFRDRASKDAFLSAIQAAKLGDKYIDGHALARLLSVDLPE